MRNSLLKFEKEISMKPILSILFVFMILVASEGAFAQTGSDYYLPLRVGNYLQFHTDGIPSGWAARTTMDSIEGTDSLFGIAFFRERSTEVADNGSFNNSNLVRWLGDSAGNVLIAAISERSSDLDSATILPGPSPFFLNETLVPGFSIRYPYSNYFMVDSTISDSETVTVAAGTFMHCIKRSETHYDSAGHTIFLEYHYFAQGVGMVLNARVIPDTQAHTDVLVQYSAVTSVHEENAANTSNRFSLSQNYPNPFNPTTVISYWIPAVSDVTLKVYDLLGREMKTLVRERQTAGSHHVTFNAGSLPSGVYLYRIQAGSYSKTMKLLLLK